MWLAQILYVICIWSWFHKKKLIFIILLWWIKPAILWILYFFMDFSRSFQYPISHNLVFAYHVMSSTPSVRYHSTIRSNSCHLLIRPPEESLCNTLSDDQAKDCYRCDECSRIRSQVLSMRGWCVTNPSCE